MDDTDRQLLELLRRDARTSFVELARQLGTSEGTVRARVKRLTADGTIRRFTILTAGAAIKAIVEIGVESNVRTSELTNEISGWPGVEAVYELTGDWDVAVVTVASQTETLNDIIDRIRGLPNVKSTRSRLILKEA